MQCTHVSEHPCLIYLMDFSFHHLQIVVFEGSFPPRTIGIWRVPGRFWPSATFRGKIHSDSRQILQSLPIHTSKKLSLFFILIHASLFALSESLSNKIKLVTASLPMQMWTIFAWWRVMEFSIYVCVWNSVVPSRFPNIFNLQIFTTVGSDCGELDYIPSFGATLSFALKKYFFGILVYSFRHVKIHTDPIYCLHNETGWRYIFRKE